LNGDIARIGPSVAAVDQGEELVARAHTDGYADLRLPHLHVFGDIDAHGTRLTELASRAGMGARPRCSRSSTTSSAAAT
jgi:hypothetical protein